MVVGGPRSSISRRSLRVRSKLKLASRCNGRKRLSVFRSDNHIYAQLIDDDEGITMASASTRGKDADFIKVRKSNTEAASAVGKMIAERSLAAGVSEVYFDRGRYRYHGRVKALAEAARSAGLSF